MVQNPPENMPRIVPYLHYNDLEKDLEWLLSVFDFKLSFTLPDKHGKLIHAEIIYADGFVMRGPANPHCESLTPVILQASTRVSMYM